MIGHFPIHARGLLVDTPDWNELNPEEQNALLRQGYKPPVGTIIHNNFDIQYPEGERIEQNFR